MSDQNSVENQNSEKGEPEAPNKIIRMLTVSLYLSFVSGMGFMLSVYYIFFWEPPTPSPIIIDHHATKHHHH